MIINYVRVSTQDQNPDFQVDAFETTGTEQIFQESLPAYWKSDPNCHSVLLRRAISLLFWGWIGWPVFWKTWLRYFNNSTILKSALSHWRNPPKQPAAVPVAAWYSISSMSWPSLNMTWFGSGRQPDCRQSGPEGEKVAENWPCQTLMWRRLWPCC